MITGEQIHEARKLLGWSRDRLAPKAGMCTNNLRQIEIGAKPVSEPEAAALCGALQEAGVEFTNGDELGVKAEGDGGAGGTSPLAHRRPRMRAGPRR